MRSLFSVLSGCAIVLTIASPCEAGDPYRRLFVLSDRSVGFQPLRSEPTRSIAQAIPRHIPRRPDSARRRTSSGRSMTVGALAGAGIGAGMGAVWATTGEEGMVPPAAGIGAAIGATTGAVTGALTSLTPSTTRNRSRWRAAAIGALVSGATLFAVGQWLGDSSTSARDFGTAGLAHGAITGLAIAAFAR